MDSANFKTCAKTQIPQICSKYTTFSSIGNRWPQSLSIWEPPGLIISRKYQTSNITVDWDNEMPGQVGIQAIDPLFVLFRISPNNYDGLFPFKRCLRCTLQIIITRNNNELNKTHARKNCA